MVRSAHIKSLQIAGLRLTNVTFKRNKVTPERNLFVWWLQMEKSGTLEKGPAILSPENSKQKRIPVYVADGRPKRKYNAKWLCLWLDDTGAGIVEQSEMEKPLTQTEYRVRDWILGTIGIGNMAFINQAEMSRRLRVARPHISKAIKRLVELQILIPGPKSGRSNSYKINENFCFYGNIGDGIKARRKEAKILNFNQNQE